MPGPLDAFLRLGTGVPGGGDDAAVRGARAAAIADLVRATLAVPDDTAVTVQQITCRETGCAPIETVIAVLSAPPRRWTLHHPLSAIDDTMVTRMLADHPDGAAS